MAINVRKSWADSILEIKTDDNRARFSRNQQNSDKSDSETLACKLVQPIYGLTSNKLQGWEPP